MRLPLYSVFNKKPSEVLFISVVVVIFAVAVLLSIEANVDYRYGFVFFGILVLALFLVKPHVLFYVTILLISFRSVVIWLWGDFQLYISFVEPAIIASFMIWLLYRLGKKGRVSTYVKTGVEIPIILLFIYGLISILWSGEQWYGYYIMFLHLCGILLFFLTVAYVDSIDRFKFAIMLFVLMGIINGILCFYVILSSGQSYNDVIFHTKNHYVTFWFNPEQMLRGQGFMHPLKTAYYLSLSIVFMFGYTYMSRGYRALGFGIMSFMLLSALMTTLSKGPLLSLFVGALLLSVEIPALKKNFIPSWVIFIVLVVVAFIVPRIIFGDINKAVDYTSQTATSSSSETSSLGSRIIRWSKAIDAVYNTYGIGVGAGGFRAFVEPAQLLDSSYFQVFFDYGFIGLWLWLWFLLVSGYKFFIAYKNYPKGKGKDWLLIYLASYITLIFNGLTSETHFFLPIWFIIGAGYALVNVLQKERLI